MGKLSSDVKDFKVETIQAVTESKDSIHDSLEEMVEIVAKTGNMVKEVKKGVKDAKLNAKTEAVEAKLEKTQELLRLVLKFLETSKTEVFQMPSAIEVFQRSLDFFFKKLIF